VVTTETQPATPEPQRRRRASTGGFALKLDAPTRPGYQRRFVNGDPARIQEMHELGYSFVTDTPAEGKARTEGKGTRITRHAGKLDSGAPMQAVLMETPDNLHAEGLAEKELARKPFEDAIRRSADTTGEVEGAYAPSTRSTINHSG
jgi:hypothetical protein